MRDHEAVEVLLDHDTFELFQPREMAHGKVKFCASSKLSHFQSIRCLLAGAKDVTAAPGMGGGVRANRIGLRPRARTKGNYRARLLCCQGEVLIAQSGCSAYAIDGNDDDGDVQDVAGFVGDDNRPRDGVVLHRGKLLPVDCQPRNYDDSKVALCLLLRHIGVSDDELEVILAGSGGHTGDHSLVWVQLEPWRKFALDATPGVRRVATLRNQREVEILSGNGCLRRLRDNFKRSWVGLRGACQPNEARRQKKKENAALG